MAQSRTLYGTGDTVQHKRTGQTGTIYQVTPYTVSVLLRPSESLTDVTTWMHEEVRPVAEALPQPTKEASR